MAGDSVSQIKDRIDVVELVGSRVQLRQTGRSFKGLCPFHNEKTPSFVVFPDSQSYHCFGCGKSGDIFSFVMDTENLDFSDALKLLAERANVEIRQTSRPDPEKDVHRERLIDLNERAASYFSNVLWTSALGEPARDLLQRRGVDRATAERFGLGFAPDSWDALKNHLLRRTGVTEEVLLEAGLQSKSDNGRVYDRFRNRLMFPIRDRSGRAIGFGARALGDEMPKYLNSPQTEIFNKSDALYAIDVAEESIRKDRTLVVVEGYMDAIAAHQFGFANVVASMGTALTSQQIGSIRRYVDRVFLALDADAAGQMATLRAIDSVRDSFSESDRPTVDAGNLIRFERALAAEVRIVPLTGGKDPDEMIRADPASWTAAIAGAVPLVEYVLHIKLAEVEPTAVARARALQEDAVPVLREIRDQAVLAQYVGLAARLLNYKDTDVRRAMRLSPNRRTEAARSDSRPRESDHERHLIGLLVRQPITTQAQIENVASIDINDILDARHREIVAAVKRGDGMEEILADLPEEVAVYARSLRDLTTDRTDWSPGMAHNELRQTVRSLSISRYRERELQLKNDIDAAKASGNIRELQALVQQMQELMGNRSIVDPETSPYFKDSRTASV